MAEQEQDKSPQTDEDFPLPGDKKIARKAKRSGSPQARLGVGLMIATAGGLLGYAVWQKTTDPRAPMPTSTAGQLAQTSGGDDVGRMSTSVPAATPTAAPHVDIPPPAAVSGADLGLGAEVAQLKEQVAALQAAPPQGGDLKSQFASLQQQMAKMETDNAAQIAALNANLTASQLQGQSASETEDAKRKAMAAAAMNARIASKSVIFDGGSNGTAGGSTGAASGAVTGVGADLSGGGYGSRRGQISGDALGRAFVTGAQAAPPIERASKIADPAHTVLQGTVLQATLETGINSSLPGQLVAVVSYPVYAFDQSRILIPVGTKLFGSYSSDIGLGQARILVGWTRLVTPDGQSVTMKAFGADDQGVSGVGGQVHSRFGLKFGSAALISLIATAPQVVASKATNQTATTAVQSVGQDLGGATQSAIGQYVTLPNVITVDPGTAVSVIVDRDLGIY